ncbi:hypothetical protein K2Y11_11035 [bacterium]|nr:hypothetical protein [bacterium]
MSTILLLWGRRSSLHESEFILIAGLVLLAVSLTVNECNLAIDQHSIACEQNDRKRAIREFEKPTFHMQRAQRFLVVAKN